MKVPCYDDINRKDCPDRKAGCAVDCYKWAEYVRARDAEYKAKQAQRAADDVLIQGMAKRRDFMEKDKIKNSHRHRG